MGLAKYRIKGKSEMASIYVRIRNGRTVDMEVSTKIKVPKKYWSNAKNKVKTVSDFNYDLVNEELRKLDNFLTDEFNKASSKGSILNNVWLRQKIDENFNRINQTNDNTLTSFIDEFIEYRKSKKDKNGKPFSKRSIQRYNTTKVKILDYEKFENVKLNLEDISLEFHSKFTDFLSNEHGLNNNAISFYVVAIKAVCRKAEEMGKNVNKDYKNKDFYNPSNETYDIYLTEEEIEQVFTYDFSKNDRLDNVRDWFIVGLWTGLRISDFMVLSKKNIRDDGLIEITNKKTGINVIIPIHPQISSVLKKRKGNFPKPISSQKFNQYVKEVCKEIGFNDVVKGAKMTKVKTNIGEKTRKQIGEFHKHELIGSHICRRSFASNLYGKIDTLTIMKITGHKTESQFLDYIKITPKEHAEKLKQLWAKQYQNG
ncbi:MAG: phage integrase SAM-like domain-containing protein [Flavobacteriaceae bacterium]|nr:phage integrase SAM-like domain-containing protein [Flavobacteriaceae bacterium]